MCPHTSSPSAYHPPVAEHLIAQHSAIKMLHSRVKLILEYVKASEAGRTGISLVPEALCLPSGEATASTLMPFLVPSGEVPFNHEILREAYALCHCLPVLSTDKFKTDFYDVSARPRTGRWGSRVLHAGHDRLLSLHSNAMMWGSWPTLAPSPRRATP